MSELKQLVKTLEEMPEAARDYWVGAFLAQIAREKTEADARWEETLESPESVGALQKLIAEAEKERAEGALRPLYDELDRRAGAEGP